MFMYTTKLNCLHLFHLLILPSKSRWLNAKGSQNIFIFFLKKNHSCFCFCILCHAVCLLEIYVYVWRNGCLLFFFLRLFLLFLFSFFIITTHRIISNYFSSFVNGLGFYVAFTVCTTLPKERKRCDKNFHFTLWLGWCAYDSCHLFFVCACADVRVIVD